MLITHVRSHKMCAVDTQYVKVFVNKHNVAIENWERHSLVAYPQPLSYSVKPCKHKLCTYKSNVYAKHVVLK